MMMPGRSYTASGKYRYGFNGKENDNEVKGDGNQQDYGMRIYDTRLGKFWSVDPLMKSFPWYSPFHFAGNTPIANIDLDGTEPKYVAAPNSNGTTKLTYPVVAMLSRLYDMNYYIAGTKANIVFNQNIHDKITKYKSGAITLGFEINYTEDYRTASDRDFLQLTSHEIVHVKQFISQFGEEFKSQKSYGKAVLRWMANYVNDALIAKENNKDNDFDELHDKIPIEIDANSKSKYFSEFLRENDFERVRKTKTGTTKVKDNRVLNLLKAMDESKTTGDVKRFSANFNTLMKLIDEFKEKKKNEEKKPG